jgi:hypothetical protein
MDVALTVWMASGFTAGAPPEGAAPPPRLAWEVEDGGERMDWSHAWALPYGGSSLPLLAPTWRPDLGFLYGMHVSVPLTLLLGLWVSAACGWNWALEVLNTILALWAVLSPLRAPSFAWCIRYPLDLLVALAVREVIRTLEPAHAVVRRRHLVNFV